MRGDRTAQHGAGKPAPRSTPVRGVGPCCSSSDLRVTGTGKSYIRILAIAFSLDSRVEAP